MKSIALGLLSMLFSTSTLAQVLIVSQSSISKNEDGLTCLSTNASAIPQDAHIDLVVLRVELGNAEFEHFENVALLNGEGRRVSIAAISPTKSTNRGTQVLKFLVTEHLQKLRARQTDQCEFIIKPMKTASVLDLGSLRTRDFELVVYYTMER